MTYKTFKNTTMNWCKILIKNISLPLAVTKKRIYKYTCVHVYLPLCKIIFFHKSSYLGVVFFNRSILIYLYLALLKYG